MEISLLTLNKKSKREKVTSERFEYIYLINGAISYELESETFDMEVGLSLFYDGHLPHMHLTTSTTGTLHYLLFILFQQHKVKGID